MNACTGLTDNALFARLLLMIAVMINAACAKDDTINNESIKAELEELSPPVKVQEWYPTPKRLSNSATYTMPSTAAGGGIQSPARSAAQQGSKAVDRQIMWPSQATTTQEYSPWHTPQATQAPGQSANVPGQSVTRRPWGALDNSTRSSQRQQSQQVWQPQPAQPNWQTQGQQFQQQPGMYGPNPGLFPVYVW
jgi:hypothetical protein